MTREELIVKIEDIIRNECQEAEMMGSTPDDQYYEGLGPDSYGAALQIMKLFDQFTQGEAE